VRRKSGDSIAWIPGPKTQAVSKFECPNSKSQEVLNTDVLPSGIARDFVLGIQDFPKKGHDLLTTQTRYVQLGQEIYFT
jgi:hypothetical protein